MGTTVAKLTTQGDLQITGAVNERLPSITNGLVAHYPLDGSLKRYKSLSSLNILASTHDGTVNNTSWITWFNSLGATVTITIVANLAAVDVATASQYDLIVHDQHVWACDPSTIAQMKVFVDAGIPCIAIGNDTGTNIFAAERSSTAHTTHNVVVDLNAPGIGEFTGVELTWGSGDVYGGITKLQNGAKPLYYRTDTGEIMGYYYKSAVSNAMFYFDQEGNGMQTMMQMFIQIVVNSGIKDVVANNCTLTPLGMFSEEATTNLISGNNNIFFGTAPTKWYENSTDFDFSPYASNPVSGKLGALTVKSVGGFMYHDRITIDLTKTYTASMIVRVLTGNVSSLNCGGTIFYTDSSNDDFTWITTNRLVTKLAKGLYRVSYTFTGNSAKTLTGYEPRISILTPGNTHFIVYSFQVEEKPFPTMPVVGSRAVTDTGIRIKLPVKTLPFSVSMEVTPDIVNNINAVYGSEPQNMYVASWWNRTDTYLGVIHQWLRSTTPTKKFRYTMVFYATNRVVIYYDNAMIKDTTYFVDRIPTLTEIPYFTIGARGFEPGFSLANAKYENVSIYNKTLSADEVSKLCGHNFKPNKYGDINGGINELPSNIPTDMHHIPLGMRSDVVSKFIPTISNTDAVYNENGVWIGTTVQNLASLNQSTGGDNTNNIDGFTPRWGTTISRVTDVKYSGTGSIKVVTQGANSDEGVSVTLTGIPANTYYSFSVKVRGTGTIQAGLGQQGVGYITPETRKTITLQRNKWITVTYTSITPSTFNGKLEFNISTASAQVTTFWVDEYMIQASQFISPYTKQSRGYGTLAYNLYDSIGMDWRTDWTIVFFKKPIGTGDAKTEDVSKSLFSIESIGSPTANTSYLYFGKTISADSMVVTYNIKNAAYVEGTKVSFDASKFFDKWHMVSITKSGTTITYKTYARGLNTTTTVTLPANFTAANELVYGGWDLMLGGWFDGRCNSYYRDLMVAKRLLTQTELDNIATHGLKSKDAVTYVQGSLSENNIL